MQIFLYSPASLVLYVLFWSETNVANFCILRNFAFFLFTKQPFIVISTWNDWNVCCKFKHFIMFACKVLIYKMVLSKHNFNGEKLQIMQINKGNHDFSSFNKNENGFGWILKKTEMSNQNWLQRNVFRFAFSGSEFLF